MCCGSGGRKLGALARRLNATDWGWFPDWWTGQLGHKRSNTPPANKKAGLCPALKSPCLFVALFLRSGKDWSFVFWNPIASEQHSSSEPPPKLALLQRSAKFNVA